MKFSRFFLKLIAALSASTLLSSVCVILRVTEAQSVELVPPSATKQLKANLSIEQIDQITFLLTEADNMSQSQLTAVDWYNRGVEKLNSGDNQGAIEDYTQAIRLDPNYAHAYNNRGLARYNLGDNQGAIEDYTQGINIDPNDADAYNNRGVARYELGDNQGGIEDLEKAAELFRQQGDPRAAELEETIRKMK